MHFVYSLETQGTSMCTYNVCYEMCINKSEIKKKYLNNLELKNQDLDNQDSAKISVLYLILLCFVAN